MAETATNLTEIHPSKSEYRCLICKRLFANIHTLKRHKQVHSGERPFPCSLCFQSFTANHCLKRHMSIHTDEHPYKCHLCHSSFPCKSDQGRHIKGHMKDPTCCHCKRCLEIFKHEEELEQHQIECELKRPYICQVCSRGFAQNSAFMVHIKNHEAQKPYQCDMCEKAFVTAVHMQMHRSAVHLGKRKFECKYCDRSFYLHTHLLEHQSVVHLRNSGRHYCHRCNKTFANILEFNAHKTTHSVKCKTCGVICKNLDDMTKHLEIHVKEKNSKPTIVSTVPKPFSDPSKRVFCNICEQGFTRFFNMSVHQMQRHGVKASENKYTVNKNYQPVKKKRQPQQMRHKCPKCGKRFKLRKLLSIHMKAHIKKLDDGLQTDTMADNSDNIPLSISHYKYPSHYRYACPECGRRYVKIEEVHNHLKRVHNLRDEDIPMDIVPESPIKKIRDKQQYHQCGVCKRIFTRQLMLNVHLDKHTTDEINEAKKNDRSGKEKKFECKVCHCNFKLEIELLTHSRQHNNKKEVEKQPTVKKTAKVFKIPMVDRNKTDALFSCKVCGNKFEKKRNVLLHQKKHASEDFTFFMNKNGHGAISLSDSDCEVNGENCSKDDSGSSKPLDNSINDSTVNGVSRKHTTEVVEFISDQADMETEDGDSVINTPYRTQEEGRALNVDDPMDDNGSQEEEEWEEEDMDNTSTDDYRNVESPLDDADTAEVKSLVRMKQDSLAAVGGKCPECKQDLIATEPQIQCVVCSRHFCLSCGNVASETYKLLKKADQFHWMCIECKPLVPMLTVLASQLQQFEEVLDNRMSQLEKKVNDIQRRFNNCAKRKGAE